MARSLYMPVVVDKELGGRYVDDDTQTSQDKQNCNVPNIILERRKMCKDLYEKKRHRSMGLLKPVPRMKNEEYRKKINEKLEEFDEMHNITKDMLTPFYDIYRY